MIDACIAHCLIDFATSHSKVVPSGNLPPVIHLLYGPVCRVDFGLGVLGKVGCFVSVFFLVILFVSIRKQGDGQECFNTGILIYSLLWDILQVELN